MLSKGCQPGQNDLYEVSFLNYCNYSLKEQSVGLITEIFQCVSYENQVK